MSAVHKSAQVRWTKSGEGSQVHPGDRWNDHIRGTLCHFADLPLRSGGGRPRSSRCCPRPFSRFPSPTAAVAQTLPTAPHRGQPDDRRLEPRQHARSHLRRNRVGNPAASQTLINAVKAAGFNSIRIPVSWDCHTAPTGTRLFRRTGWRESNRWSTTRSARTCTSSSTSTGTTAGCRIIRSSRSRRR